MSENSYIWKSEYWKSLCSITNSADFHPSLQVKLCHITDPLPITNLISIRYIENVALIMIRYFFVNWNTCGNNFNLQVRIQIIHWCHKQHGKFKKAYNTITHIHQLLFWLPKSFNALQLSLHLIPLYRMCLISRVPRWYIYLHNASGR